MNRPAVAWVFGVVFALGGALFVTETIGKGTPDGQPPSRETVCNSLKGAAKGLCTAYCEAQDCDVHARPSCDELRTQFQRATGSPLFPCDPRCGDGKINQQSEECDGADAGACSGPCLADCTCPTCGDGSVNRPGEVCDGSDATACPGQCLDDCACPTCGDGSVNEPGEVCDGADAAACPGLCRSDCTCPTCGDGSVNAPGEVCDGADAAACPGLCRSDCTCPPAQPNCVCYFSSDCATGSSCAYGNFDLCAFQTPKPDGVIGGGCTVPGGHVGGACDGLCVSSASGSVCGPEDRSTLSTAMLLWGEAAIRPAESGGGLVDQELARRAIELPASPECSLALGRQVQGAVLVVIAGVDFFIHPEAPHDSQDHQVADLSDDPCLVSGLRLGVEALVAEYNTPGTGAAILDGIPGLCPGALDHVPSCGEDIAPLDCVKRRVVDTGLFLRTVSLPSPG